jgi:hypothetical protein
MQFQAELPHSFDKFRPEPYGIRLRLEAHHDIVGKPHDDQVTAGLFPTPPDGLHTLPRRRLWIAGVELVIRDRRLIRTYVRFMVIRSDGYVLMSGVDVAQRGPSYSAEWASYEVFEPHVTGNPNEGLKVLLSPEATTAERDKAFRINFSCLTALRECRHPCDVLPEAWRDLRVRHPGERGDSIDADCRQAGR